MRQLKAELETGYLNFCLCLGVGSRQPNTSRKIIIIYISNKMHKVLWPLPPHPPPKTKDGDKAVDKTAHKTKLHSTYKGDDKQWDGNLYTTHLYGCAHTHPHIYILYIMYMSGCITIAQYILLRTLYGAFAVRVHVIKEQICDFAKWEL